MHVAVVKVDEETGHVEVERYAVAHDCGTVINPMLVDGQIHGGVAHGIGNALYEEVIYDETGQVLNASYMDYYLPGAMDVPRMDAAHIETPTPLNPLGCKGAGEGERFRLQRQLRWPSKTPCRIYESRSIESL